MLSNNRKLPCNSDEIVRGCYEHVPGGGSACTPGNSIRFGYTLKCRASNSDVRNATDSGRTERPPMDRGAINEYTTECNHRCFRRSGTRPGGRRNSSPGNSRPRGVEVASVHRPHLDGNHALTVRHGRYITFQFAEVAIPRSLLAEILRGLNRLRPTPLPP
jgi:hypothetical protein